MRKRRGALAFAAAALGAVLAGALAMPAPALAEATTFQVATSDEYAAAVSQINAADSGEFVIELTQDVNLGGDYRLNKNTTTIVGKGHTLSGGASATVFAEGAATVCLGMQDGSDTLTLQGGNGVPAGTMVSASSSAKVEMYAGTTIIGHSVFGSDAAVSLSGSSTFEMFGGTISGCKDIFSQTTGGVGVGSASNGSSDTCTFKMHGGSIENCSGGYGGGVRVGEGGTFVMDGGIISGCKGSWGGGVYATQATLVDLNGGTVTNNEGTYGGGVSVTFMKYSPTSFFPRKVQLSGATITNNTATYGGGVSLYNATTASTVSNITVTGNEAQVGGGVILWSNSQADFSGTGNVICNNTATGGASDIFLNKSEDTLKLYDAATMGKTFRDSGKAIDGWYVDDPLYVPAEDAEAVDVTGTIKGEKALVASYKVVPNATVIIDLGDGSASTTETVNVGETIAKPADPVREGYRFDGWYAEGASDPFDFTQPITSDLTISAHWVRVWTVSFDDDQGNVTSDVVDEGTVISAPAKPAREGYKFLGWYAEGSDAVFDFTQPIEGEVKLVAKWGKVVEPTTPTNPGDSGNTGNTGDADKGDKPNSGANKGNNGKKDDKAELPQTGDIASPVAIFAVTGVAALAVAALRRRA